MAREEIKALKENSWRKKKSELVTQVQYLDLGVYGKGCIQFNVLVAELSS